MKILSAIGALAIIALVAAAVFFFGGFYNVAATEPDLGVVAWALVHIREASINRPKQARGLCAYLRLVVHSCPAFSSAMNGA